MRTKSQLCAGVSIAVALAAAAPARGQDGAGTGQGTPAASGAQDLPKPASPSDLSANPSSPLPSEQISPEEGGDIVVTGLRRSIQSAQALKRNSDGIVDAVVAEDIGKLPDTFASSALQRVTGVQVTRGGGEAAGVQVRGLPDISTTYNGREIFTAENRFVAIQDFPAGTVAALEVYKSSTANLVEGGIGGQVNVRGRRPFDFNGFELSGSVNEIHWEQSQRFSPNGNLLVSDRWDTGVGEIGVLLNGSYVGLNFLDSTREQSLVIATATEAQAPGATPGFRYPDAQALYLGGGRRWRPSANGAIQWKPSDELEFYADGLFQGFRSRDTNRYMFVPIFGDGLQLTDVALRQGSNSAQSATVTGAVRPDGFYGSVNAKTDTYQVGGGTVWKRNGLQFSADVAYTKSTYRQTSANIDYAFASSPTRRVDFDTPGDDGGPVFDFGSFSVTDPANFISRGLFQENLRAVGEDIQARADLQYDLSDTGFLRRIQFGVRYDDRDADRSRGSDYVNNEGARVALTALPVEVGFGKPGFTYNDVFPVKTFAAVPSSNIRANLPALRQAFGRPADFPPFSPLEAFTANERSYTAYGQLKWGFDLGATAIDGLVGLRAVRTRTRISGTSRIISATGETFQLDERENEYTDYLPNVSARVGLSDRLQLRLAYTQTRTRPNFLQLNPSTTVNPQQGSDPIRGASGGNPDLTPLNSTNYDVSLEWYFSNTGSLTGAVFRRDARGFIANQQTVLTDPVYGQIRLDRPVNLNDTRLQGAELAFTSFLDFADLPDWARGFGIQANVTYNDATEEQATGDRRFNGVSKWSGNLVGLYERPKFAARLAYNYRSSFVQFYSSEAPVDNLTGLQRGLVERSRGQLDASTSITPVPNLTIAFDVVNLLGNPIRRSRPYDDASDIYPRQILYLERTYSLGVRFRF